jgi:hypothetical protein
VQHQVQAKHIAFAEFEEQLLAIAVNRAEFLPVQGVLQVFVGYVKLRGFMYGNSP